MVLADLPYLPNGKVDVKNLPPPPDLSTPYVAPETATEQKLAAIWEEVLGQSAPGVHDNFFEMGGHSLLAAQVVARVREAFQIDIGLVAMFEVPTIAALADVIDTLQWAAAPPRSSPFPDSEEREEFDL